MKIKLLKDVDNLKAGTVIETRTMPFMGGTVFEVTTERGTYWVGMQIGEKVL